MFGILLVSSTLIGCMTIFAAWGWLASRRSIAWVGILGCAIGFAFVLLLIYLEFQYRHSDATWQIVGNEFRMRGSPHILFLIIAPTTISGGLCALGLGRLFTRLQAGRRRFRFSLRTLFTAVFALCIFIGIWSMTLRFGGRHVSDRVNNIFTARESTKIEFDPYYIREKKLPSRDWHYVGNESAPFPLVVGVDITFAQGQSLLSYRIYYLWFFGATVHLPLLDTGRLVR